MKFQPLNVSKQIGLLLLLVNTQLNIGQEVAEAKNAFRPQSKSSGILLKSSQTEKLSSNSVCPAQLRAEIEAVTNLPQFSRGRWGILIQSLSSSRTLYSRDAQKYFVPASNVKLFTTAAALHQLSSKFRIRTSVYGTSESLYVVGRGDPSLTNTQLRELAQQLSRRGIRQVQRLVAVDDYFRGSAINPSWEWSDVQADYGAPVNSLILNQNAIELKLLPQQLGQPLQVTWVNPAEATQWQIENESTTAQQTKPVSIEARRDLPPLLRITGQLRVDSKPELVALAVLNPTEHFLRHFRRALAAEGINEKADANSSKLERSFSLVRIQDRYTQTSKHIINQRISTLPELASVESPPLSQMLVEANQNSNNLYAEALLLTLGANANNTSTNSTLEIGLRVVRSTLTKLGVAPSGYVLADGSGLSRQNLASPEALVQTLKAMARSQESSVYRASLPVAGVSGTLRNRFRASAAQGIVRAKTGTISGAVALSGYLDAPNYEPLVFSIIMNQFDQPAATIRQAMDEIVLLLSNLHRC